MRIVFPYISAFQIGLERCSLISTSIVWRGKMEWDNCNNHRQQAGAHGKWLPDWSSPSPKNSRRVWQFSRIGSIVRCSAREQFPRKRRKCYLSRGNCSRAEQRTSRPCCCRCRLLRGNRSRAVNVHLVNRVLVSASEFVSYHMWMCWRYMPSHISFIRRNMLHRTRDRSGSQCDIITPECSLTKMVGHMKGNWKMTAEYLSLHLQEVLDSLIEDGSKVFGYTVWSLIDTLEFTGGLMWVQCRSRFEFDSKRAICFFSPKFGLYAVNFSSPERTRTPKASSKYMAEVMSTRRIPYNHWLTEWQREREIEKIFVFTLPCMASHEMPCT